MKPEAQRIAIAEACGWKISTVQVGDAFPYSWISPTGEAIGSKWMDASQVRSHNAINLPNYLTDLNAMHEAEDVIAVGYYAEGISLRGGYNAQLSNVLGKKCEDNLFWFIHATAAQRAEAFLKTLGKWQPEDRLSAGKGGK